MSDNLEIVQFEDQPREVSDLMIDWMALSDGLHESWADWLPFLVFGVPYVQIAKIFGVDKSAITNALKFNTDFAKRVSQGRKIVKRQLHYVWLDQKAVNAWKNIDYYLNLDPYEKDDGGDYIYPSSERRAMFQEKAKMTRFVLQQLGLHVQRHEVLHHTPQPMFMGDNILAEQVINRVKEIMSGDENNRDIEAISAEYRVITGRPSDEVEEFEPTEEEGEIEAPYKRRSRVSGYAE